SAPGRQELAEEHSDDCGPSHRLALDNRRPRRRGTRPLGPLGYRALPGLGVGPALGRGPSQQPAAPAARDPAPCRRLALGLGDLSDPPVARGTHPGGAGLSAGLAVPPAGPPAPLLDAEARAIRLW